MTEKPFAFVLMPFDSSFNDVYRLGIQAAADELGIIASRVDEQVFHKEGIIERIYNQINVADFIIADMTGKNPNVFYEVGYAHAKNKLCVLLTASADDIPFDLKHHRHIVYGNSVAGLKDKLKEDILFMKAELTKRGSPVSIELAKLFGDLSKTKYDATAKISIYLDIKNGTQFISPDIEAIYFYTGGGWAYKQDGQDCPKTKADFEDYTLKHLIKSPVARLPRGGWAQVKLIGEKVIAWSWKGDEIKDSYKLSGKALIRVLTANSVFDYPLNIELEVAEFPF